MGNEQSTEEGVVGQAPEVSDGPKAAQIASLSTAEQNLGNGDSTTASSPRRSSLGMAASTDSSPSAKPKAKAKAKSKAIIAGDAQSKKVVASARKSTSGELATDASPPSPPAQEEGMARYMTLSGLQELFAFHTYGLGSQQASQEEGSDDGKATDEAAGQGGADAGDKLEEAGASAESANGVSRYLPASLEEVSDMFEKARADAREGAAALYEKAKIEAAVAKEVASGWSSGSAHEQPAEKGGADAVSKSTEALEKDSEGAGDNLEATGASAETADGASRYLPSSLEEVSGMLEKARADAREGAAALYEKAKIQGAHAKEVATAAASSMAPQPGGNDDQKVESSSNEEAKISASDAASSSAFARYFSFSGVSEMFRTDTTLLTGEASSAAAAASTNAATAANVASAASAPETSNAATHPPDVVPSDSNAAVDAAATTLPTSAKSQPKGEEVDKRGNEAAPDAQAAKEATLRKAEMSHSAQPNNEMFQRKSSSGPQPKKEEGQNKKEGGQAKTKPAHAKSNGAQARNRTGQHKSKGNQHQHEGGQSRGGGFNASTATETQQRYTKSK